MSQPPEYPGSRRLKRAAARAGGGAYEGAFEAVGAIVIAIGIGYWVDTRYETTPTGVLSGAVIGFAAFVLRLVRLGRQLHPDGSGDAAGGTGPEVGEDLGVGEAPGLSDALREDEDENERTQPMERD